MVAPTHSDGYSAYVELELHIGETTFPLGQIGGGELYFEHVTTLPGTSGEVVARIDQHVQRWLATWEPSDTPRRIVPVTMRPI